MMKTILLAALSLCGLVDGATISARAADAPVSVVPVGKGSYASDVPCRG